MFPASGNHNSIYIHSLIKHAEKPASYTSWIVCICKMIALLSLFANICIIRISHIKAFAKFRFILIFSTIRKQGIDLN